MLRLLLPFVLLLVVFVVALLRAAQRRSALRKKFGKQFQGATATVALCAHESDLSGTPKQLLQAAKGFALLRRDGASFVGSRFSADETLDFARALGWRVSFLPANALAISLPDMVRVANADDAYFLMGLGALDQPSKAATKKLYADLQRCLERRQGAQASPNSSPPILLAAFALLLAAVGVMLYASVQGSKPLGPQILARGPNGSVLSATEDALLHFSADGSVLNAVPLSTFGFNQGVAGLRALPDGSILAGDFAEGSIKRCAADGSNCTPLQAFATSNFRFRGGFSFELNPGGDSIFASDSGRHRMMKISLGDGGVLDEYRGDDSRSLCFPNALRILDDGRLLAADTNNFRILEWPSSQTWPEPAPVAHSMVESPPIQYGCKRNDREGHGNPELDRALDYSIVGNPQALTGLNFNATWVAQFDHSADGRWWVVFNADNVRRGNVGILDANWSLQKVLDLPVSADPWDVLTFGDGALVADPVAAKIYRFNASGLQISDFGGKALADYLAPAKARNKMIGIARIAAPCVMALIIVSLLPVSLFTRKRRVREILAMPRP